jgi:hypothetical protein
MYYFKKINIYFKALPIASYGSWWCITVSCDCRAGVAARSGSIRNENHHRQQTRKHQLFENENKN